MIIHLHWHISLFCYQPDYAWRYCCRGISLIAVDFYHWTLVKIKICNILLLFKSSNFIKSFVQKHRCRLSPRMGLTLSFPWSQDNNYNNVYKNNIIYFLCSYTYAFLQSTWLTKRDIPHFISIKPWIQGFFVFVFLLLQVKQQHNFKQMMTFSTPYLKL